MHNQELIHYIREQRARGIGNEAIRHVLLQTGWQINDINAAFAALTFNTSLIQSISMQPITPAQSRQHLEQGIMPQTPVSSFSTAKLASVGDLLQFAFEVVRLHWKKMLKIEVMSTLLIASFAGIMAVGLFLVGGFQLPPEETSFPQLWIMHLLQGPSGFILLIALVIGMAGILIAQLWSYLTIIRVCLSRHEKIGTKAAFGLTTNNILPFLGMSILAGLAIFGGLLFLIIPGIIVAILFSQSAFVLLQEQTGIMEALRRSRRYVQHRKWAVLGRLAALGLMLSLLSTAINITTSGITNTHEIIGKIVAIILAIIFNIFSPMMTTAYNVGLYESLKATSGETR